MENTPDLLSSDFLSIDDSSGENLRSASIWAKTIGGISIAITLILILWFTFLGGKLQNFSSLFYSDLSFVLIVVAILLAVVAFYVVMLFRFSSGITDGLNNQDTTSFEKGIDSLRILFMVSGILSFLYLLLNLISSLAFL